MRNILPLLLLVASACSSLHTDITVKSRKFADIDLRAVQTYQWSESSAHVVDTTGTWSGDDTAVQALVREAVNRELQALGLVEVAAGGALRVECDVVATRAQAEAAQGHVPDPVDDPIVTEGSLLVEIFHTSTNALVWRGSARSTARQVFPLETTRVRIDLAVHEMFESLQP